MNAKARIAVDTRGLDNLSLGPVVQGVVDAARKGGMEVIMVGPKSDLEPELHISQLDADQLPISIHHMDEEVRMTDNPDTYFRGINRLRVTTMSETMRLVKEGSADAAVTFGNSGVAMVYAIRILDRLPGVKRPGLGILVPKSANPGKQATLLMDVGANADCKPEHLLEFSRLGVAYMKALFGGNPTVGILSLGEEDYKGDVLVKEASKLLANQHGRNFRGNVEASHLFTTEVDIAVTDGFSGNLVLKTAEAAFSLVKSHIRSSLQPRGWEYVLAPGLIKAGKKIKESFQPYDWRRFGATPLLGVNGLCLVGHGKSDALAVEYAIHTAVHLVRKDVMKQMQHYRYM